MLMLKLNVKMKEKHKSRDIKCEVLTVTVLTTYIHSHIPLTTSALIFRICIKHKLSFKQCYPLGYNFVQSVPSCWSVTGITLQP